MAEFKLKKGYDIRVAGAAEKIVTTLGTPKTVAVTPMNFAV